MKTSNGNIRIGEYSFDSENVLGKGATGYVYKGFRIPDSVNVAVKAIEMVNINNQVTQYLLQGEKKAMKDINHKNVVKCYDIIQQHDYCYIIMQQCTGGTLQDFIKSKGKLNQVQAIPIFRKIVSGYCAVIDNLFIHRDLKTANIMLRDNKQPVIIDFGYCQRIMGKRPLIKYNVGSPSYMSPQAYQQSRYSQKSDVWALGAILYEMLTGKTLDNSYPIKQYFEKVKEKSFFDMKVNCSFFSSLIKQVFQSTFCISPEERATSHKIKYLFDKNLGPMIDLENLPPGAIIKPMNTSYLSIGTQNSKIYEQPKFIQSLRFSSGKNPLAGINFVNIQNTLKTPNQTETNTSHNTPLKKQFIRKGNPLQTQLFNLKPGDIQLKERKTNDKKCSFNQSFNHWNNKNLRSNQANFKNQRKLIFRSKFLSANQNLQPHFVQSHQKNFIPVPQVSQFNIISNFTPFQQSSRSSQISHTNYSQCYNHQSQCSIPYNFKNNKNVNNLISYGTPLQSKQRVITHVQQFNQYQNFQRPPLQHPRINLVKKNYDNQCPKSFVNLRII